MCKKCICLIRVSTLQQSLEEQREKVVATAIADGYKRSEIAVVEGKESAIKLKEEQRETINEMKQIINDNPSIESVYVFAIDRLARRVSVIMSVKEYLDERGINLVFLNPHKMGTLRKDEKTGKMVEDELTKLLLMLLSYGAEMEMQTKKARFAVAKDALRKQGKLATGKVLYGYYRAEDGTAKVNEVEASKIRDLFNYYVSEDISLARLFKKMVFEGKWEDNVSSTGWSTRIRNIFLNKAYSGGVPMQRTRGKKGVVRTEKYPAIVTEELQNKAIEKLMSNQRKPKTETKNIYYGKGLIKIEHNGKLYALAPIRNNVTYSLLTVTRANININVIDSILWDEAITLKRHHMNVDKEQTRKAYNEQIEKNNAQIEVLRPKLEEIRKRQAQAFQMLMKGRVSEDIYDETMKEIGEDETNYSNEIARLETANTNMSMMLNEIADAKVIESNLSDITDDAERDKIIKQVIEMIVIKKTDKGYEIEVVPKDILKPLYYPHTYEYSQSGGHIKLFMVNPNGHKSNQNRIVQRRFKQYDRRKK